MSIPEPELLIMGVAVCVIVLMLAELQRALSIAVTGLALTSTTLFPLLLSTDSPLAHVGVAGPVPELRTFSLIFLAGLGLAWIPRRSSYALWGLSIYLVVGWAFLWPRSDVVAAGLIQMLVAVGAWAIGRWAFEASQDKRRFAHAIVAIAGLVVAVQVAVGLLQSAGVPINPLASVESALVGNRVNGTMNHPNNLGKALVLLDALLLGAMGYSHKTVRRWAAICVAGSFIPIILAQGRANFFGAMAMIVLWALLAPARNGRNSRVAVLLGALLVGLVGAGVMLSRFDEDPDGGVRSDILEVAIRHLPEYALWGMGPNNYTSTIGPLEGTWIPVHNSFVLGLAELGTIGALLLFAAPSGAILRGIRGVRCQAPHGYFSRALLASSVALLIIGLSGWGLIGTSMLGLWFFTWGLMDGGQRDVASSSAWLAKGRPLMPVRPVPGGAIARSRGGPLPRVSQPRATCGGDSSNAVCGFCLRSDVRPGWSSGVLGGGLEIRRS